MKLLRPPFPPATITETGAITDTTPDDAPLPDAGLPVAADEAALLAQEGTTFASDAEEADEAEEVEETAPDDANDPGVRIESRDPGTAQGLKRRGEAHPFAERLASLAAAPGVYLMKSADGTVIYVGKAQSLRDRVRSYFGSPRSMTGKTRELVKQIADFEVIRTGTAREALILENELIKRYLPHYNIRLKDDKSYPYLKITNEEWPRVVITRRVPNDGGRYFGPITTGGSPQRTLDLLEKLFQFRKCSIEITGNQRPCLYYHLHRCLAPCASKTTPEEYEGELSRAGLLLSGKDDTIKADLVAKRDAASEDLRFEQAQRYQEDIRALEHVLQRQRIVSQRDADADVLAVARGEGGDAAVQVLNVRGHKIHGTEHLRLVGARIDDENPTLLARFIEQYYNTARSVPPLLIVQHALPADDRPALVDFLRERRGGKVEIVTPQRGERVDLVKITAESAAENLQQERLRWLTDEQKMTAALSELQEALELSGWPRRIECYDISNTQGTNSVASMVVFEDAKPKKADYRKFAIKTVEGANDFASMKEGDRAAVQADADARRLRRGELVELARPRDRGRRQGAIERRSGSPCGVESAARSYRWACEAERGALLTGAQVPRDPATRRTVTLPCAARA